MKYNITGQVTVSCYTEVEAASISQAILIAQERSLASLSNNCFSGEVDECGTLILTVNQRK